MNDYQNATLASYKLIVIEAKSNPEAVALIPSFSNGINRLEAITVEIDSLSVEQSKNITGITEGKNEVLEELAGYVIDVAGALHSYAVAKGDNTLMAKVNFKPHKVHIMNQSELVNAAGVVIEEAAGIRPQSLADEGITAEEITRFTELYTMFKGITGNKRQAVIERSGHTDRIAVLFAEASALKKNTLDRLATQFLRKAPDFYKKYKAAANVIYRRSTKTATSVPGQE